MTFKIQITETAEKDINDALDYIEKKLFNPKAADDLLEKILEDIQKLSLFPEKHQLIADPALSDLGIRFIKINSHLAFYTIDKNTKTVFFFRFLYEKRNWINILKNEK